MVMNLKVKAKETIEDLAHQITGTLWARARWGWETESPVHLPYGKLFRTVKRELEAVAAPPGKGALLRLDPSGERCDFEAIMAQAIMRATHHFPSVTPLMILGAIQDSLQERISRGEASPGDETIALKTAQAAAAAFAAAPAPAWLP